MNENINLCGILKNCPRNHEFYSPIYGVVRFVCIDSLNRIICRDERDTKFEVRSDGHIYNYDGGECILFPSKGQRDWSKFNKFDPTELKPFDKMLVKEQTKWDIEFFGYYDKEQKTIAGMSEDYTCYAIPFNENTEHLLSTSEDCDEYYKWWEE